MAIFGPGDTDEIRLALHTGWEKTSVMKVETGEATPVYYLDVISRTLASIDELERRSYGFTEEQARQVHAQLGELLG